MEQTECSETSAYKIQTPGNYPEERTQHLEQGESLKSINNGPTSSFSSLVECGVLEITVINPLSLNPQVQGKLEKFISNSTVSWVIIPTNAAVIYNGFQY